MTINLEGCVKKTAGSYTVVERDARRIAAATKRLGGALMLTSLPDNVKAVLKSTTDPKVKADMLEFCADNKWILEGVE